jgi:hypothetical protein
MNAQGRKRFPLTRQKEFSSMEDTINKSRRRLLEAIPAMTAAMAPVAAKALAGLPAAAAVADDPIFAVIEAHREAMRAVPATLWATDQLIKSGIEGSWSYRTDEREPPAGCTDNPKWIATQLAERDAFENVSDALLKVLTTRPATIAGVAAVLAHVGLPMFPDEKFAITDDTILFATTGSWRDDIVAAGARFPAAIATTLHKLIAAA